MTDRPTSVFDVATMRAAISESGLAVSDLAFRVDVAVRSLQRILNGEPDPGEIRVATLARLADTLGVPLRSLIAPPQSADGGTAQDGDAAAAPASDDAATVIALLYDREAPALNGEMAAALGWSLDRLKSALRDAGARLRPAGLRIVREHGESSIRPVGDHLKDRRAMAAVQAHARGLTMAEYVAAYQMHRGHKVSAPNETRRRFVLGRLAKVGAVGQGGIKPMLSEAARFAHPGAP